MSYSRREFLGLASTSLATSLTVPKFVQQTAWAAAGQERQSDRVLVVLQLTGGNDGLNTVVPFTDDNYRRLRPKLHLADAELHRLDDRVGLHPALDRLKTLFDGEQVAVVQSVGYPNPNRSHFESMATWHTAPSDQQLQQGKAAIASGGWLARAIDYRADTAEQASSFQALRIGTGEIPQALLGCRVQVPSLMEMAQLKHRAGLLDEATVRAQLAAWKAGDSSSANPLLQAALQSSAAVQTSAEQLEKITLNTGNDAKYPDSPLADRLRLVAQLIRSGLSTSVYYTEHQGFDTHSRQLSRHTNVLRNFARAVAAFIKDLDRHVPSRPVLVMVFSEFGRRIKENASGGTDHGTAGPVFLVGNGVVPGVHGPYPDLENLVDGDPVFSVDFRQVYATILEKWLGLSGQTILGRHFETLDILRPAVT